MSDLLQLYFLQMVSHFPNSPVSNSRSHWEFYGGEPATPCCSKRFSNHNHNTSTSMLSIGLIALAHPPQHLNFCLILVLQAWTSISTVPQTLCMFPNGDFFYQITACFKSLPVWTTRPGRDGSCFECPLVSDYFPYSGTADFRFIGDYSKSLTKLISCCNLLSEGLRQFFSSYHVVYSNFNREEQTKLNALSLNRTNLLKMK